MDVTSIRLPPAIQGFLDDLRRDPDPKLRELHAMWAQSFAEIEAAGDLDVNALALMQALEWICGQPRTVRERLEALVKLAAHSMVAAIMGRRVHFNLRELTGWNDDARP